MTLSVGGPLALGLTTTKDANGNPIASVATPNPFTISAYFQNQTDLAGSGLLISPVTVFLDLPKGLALSPGETNPKTLLNVAAGQESGASWSVMPDPANPVSGVLTYTVNQSNSIAGSSIQRTIEVPVPAIYDLQGTNSTQGLYKIGVVPVQLRQCDAFDESSGWSRTNRRPILT